MRIAMLQSKPQQGSVLDALDHLALVASEAAAAGADILVTPEMFLSGYNITPKALRHATDMVSEHAPDTLSDLARSLDLALVVGLPDVVAEGQIANAAWLVDATGERVARYHKTHLYGDLDRALFVAGDALCPVVELTLRDETTARVSLAICYDIEFPEVARALALEGTEFILVPTANMVPYYDVGTKTIPKRAEENSVVIAYANYCGREGSLTYCGSSVIAAPWGSAIVVGTREMPGLLMADAPGRRPSNVVPPVDYLADRRPDLYGALVDTALRRPMPFHDAVQDDGDDDLG